MPEWLVYNKKTKKWRKAKPKEVPKPLECGISPENGIPLETKKSGVKHGKRKT